MTDLTKAIAELRRVTPPNSPWEAGDIGVGSSPVDYHISTILNAVTSGDLLPRADADLAVALMVEKAAGEGAGEVAAHGASELSPFVRRRIRALTPASALAELQALRDERDDAVASQFITRVERDGAEDHATETADELRQVRARAEAAEAELVTLRAQVERLTAKLALVQRALEKADEGLEYMGLYAPALTEGAAP